MDMVSFSLLVSLDCLCMYPLPLAGIVLNIEMNRVELELRLDSFELSLYVCLYKSPIKQSHIIRTLICILQVTD